MVRTVFGGSLLLLAFIGSVSAKDPGEFWKIDYRRFGWECDRKNNGVDTPGDCKLKIARLEELDELAEQARALQDGIVSTSNNWAAAAKAFEEKYPRVWRMRPQIRSNP